MTRCGPERPFEFYQNLRLVRREKMGWALELEDVNGIDICPSLSQYVPIRSDTLVTLSSRRILQSSTLTRVSVGQAFDGVNGTICSLHCTQCGVI